jgi:hypothetical protein
LADQVNFFPTFGFGSQLTTMIDTLITATTGAKAGISSTRETEISKILETVTHALFSNIEAQKNARNYAIAQKQKSDSSLYDSSIPEIHYPTIIIDDFLGKENLRGQYIYDILSEVLIY